MSIGAKIATGIIAVCLVGCGVWLYATPDKAVTAPIGDSSSGTVVDPPEVNVDPPELPDDFTDNCIAGYDPCVEDVGHDLDCPQIGFEVHVTGNDPYNLDGDGDGWGCEGY